VNGGTSSVGDLSATLLDQGDHLLIKLTFCLRRRPGMSMEEFQRYWRETHAALVARHADVLGIRRYVQVHTAALPGLHASLRNRNGGAPEPYDGVAELWFDSLDKLGGSDLAKQQAAAELLADERKFIDLPSSPMWFADEHVVVG
jgi:uncharacterized protein (TIGR02118 family)